LPRARSARAAEPFGIQLAVAPKLAGPVLGLGLSLGAPVPNLTRPWTRALGPAPESDPQVLAAEIGPWFGPGPCAFALMWPMAWAACLTSRLRLPCRHLLLAPCVLRLLASQSQQAPTSSCSQPAAAPSRRCYCYLSGGLWFEGALWSSPRLVNERATCLGLGS
jgi:hypothetical protein